MVIKNIYLKKLEQNLLIGNFFYVPQDQKSFPMGSKVRSVPMSQKQSYLFMN